MNNWPPPKQLVINGLIFERSELKEWQRHAAYKLAKETALVVRVYSRECPLNGVLYYAEVTYDSAVGDALEIGTSEDWREDPGWAFSEAAAEALSFARDLSREAESLLGAP